MSCSKKERRLIITMYKAKSMRTSITAALAFLVCLFLAPFLVSAQAASPTFESMTVKISDSSGNVVQSYETTISADCLAVVNSFKNDKKVAAITPFYFPCDSEGHMHGSKTYERPEIELVRPSETQPPVLVNYWMVTYCYWCNSEISRYLMSSTPYPPA